MVESLPIEIIDNILGNVESMNLKSMNDDDSMSSFESMSSDEDDDSQKNNNTLLSCALVSKAWAQLAQRRIFRRVTFYDSWRGWLTESNGQLASMLDRKPILVSYIRVLEFQSLERTNGPMHDSIVGVIQRLSNVNKISFVDANWTRFSPSLVSALTGISSMTHVSIQSSCIAKFSDLVSWLSTAANLKVLHIRQLECELEEEDVHLATTRLPSNSPSSIQLDDINLIAWFKHESCPLRADDLQKLEIYTGASVEEQANLLQLTGGSIKKLQLPMGNEQDLNIPLLGHTPNLRTLTLTHIQQSDTNSPVPLLCGVLRPFLTLYIDRTSPLQHFILELSVRHVEPLKTPRWDQWHELDALLSRQEFAYLETVTIILVNVLLDGRKGVPRKSVRLPLLDTPNTPSPYALPVLKLISSGKLPQLEKLGKLRVVSTIKDAFE